MSADPRTRARNRGKTTERSVARRLGGKRNGATGLATADVETAVFAIETKSRKTLPDWLTAAMAQAVRNAPDGKTSLLVLHELGRRHDGDLVIMRMGDFEDWFGRVGSETAETAREE